MRDTLLAYGAFGFFIMVLVLFAFVFFGPDSSLEFRKSNKFFFGGLSVLVVGIIIVFVLSFTI
jgi:hypothetical protein